MNSKKTKAPINEIKLVLHFDINKTLIFKDLKNGKKPEDMLADIIPDYSWGKVEYDEKKQKDVWKLCT